MCSDMWAPYLKVIAKKSPNALNIPALILIAGRDADHACGSAGWLQLGMAVFFYPLYAMSNSLGACSRLSAPRASSRSFSSI